MRIAVIGPSNIERVAGAAGVDPAAIVRAAEETGRLLAAAGHELVVVPDQGVPVLAAKAYRAAGGRRIRGLIPRSGSSVPGSTSRVERNRVLCDETHADLTWHEQHSRITELSDAMVCLGLSCGTICEIAWTKWTRRAGGSERIPVYILEGLGSRVPAEIGAETDLRTFRRLEDLVAALGGEGPTA